MDNNLSSKLNTVNDNINMMRDGLGLDRNASIETVRTKVTEKRKVKPYKLSFKERKDAKIENLDLIDFSGCADLRNMFTSCSNVTNLDGIKDWDVSTTRYMSYAFDCCRKLKSINVNN
jgi:surface protein